MHTRANTSHSTRARVIVRPRHLSTANPRWQKVAGVLADEFKATRLQYGRVGEAVMCSIAVISSLRRRHRSSGRPSSGALPCPSSFCRWRELRIIGNALQAGDSNRSWLPSMSLALPHASPRAGSPALSAAGIPRFEVGTPAAANAACNASTSSTRRQQLAMVVFGSIAGRGKNSIWRGPRSRISQPSALAAKTLSWAIAHTVDEIASVKLSANCNPRSLIRGWSDPEPAASSRRARASSQT
jgi:hypothetical protein